MHRYLLDESISSIKEEKPESRKNEMKSTQQLFSLSLEELEKILSALQRILQNLDMMSNKLINIRKKRILIDYGLEDEILKSYSLTGRIFEKIREFLNHVIESEKVEEYRELYLNFIQEVRKEIVDLVKFFIKPIKNRFKNLMRIYEKIIQSGLLENLLDQEDLLIFISQDMRQLCVISAKDLYLYDNRKGVKHRIHLPDVIEVEQKKSLFFRGTVIKTISAEIKIPNAYLKEVIESALEMVREGDVLSRDASFFIAEKNAVRPNFNVIRQEFLKLKQKLLIESSPSEKRNVDKGISNEQLEKRIAGGMESTNIYRANTKVITLLLRELENLHKMGDIDSETYFKLKEKFLKKFELLKTFL
ncbi:MAG: hypothetical protein ACTSX9_02145 [Candidatus Njordarchaeales archaeon]